MADFGWCKNVVIFLSIVIMLQGTSVGECTCDPSDLASNDCTLKYKIVALASILDASAVGVCLPMVGKIFPAVSPEKDVFFIVKAFAACVILATGLIPVLPDAFDKLTSPCLSENPWGNFSFTGFVAMLAAMGTLMSIYTRLRTTRGDNSARPYQIGSEPRNRKSVAEVSLRSAMFTVKRKRMHTVTSTPTVTQTATPTFRVRPCFFVIGSYLK